MKNLVKSYAVGVLVGILFFLPAISTFEWSFQKHWLQMLLFTPALGYFMYVVQDLFVKPFKENKWNLLVFLIGLICCAGAILSLENFQ